MPPGIAEVANVLVTEKVDEARDGLLGIYLYDRDGHGNEARKTAPGDRWREQCFGDAPIAAELVRPRIIKDRTARAWLRDHSGRAEFAAPLDSCSQSSAKLVILLPETSHSLYAAFFKDNSIPHGAAPPTIHDTVTRSFEPSTRGRARFVTLNV